jgi:hypothetical protein
MRRLKQFSTVVTMLAMLVLPLGVMGCAEQAPPTDTSTPAATGTDTDTDVDGHLEPELGDPEGGTNL